MTIPKTIAMYLPQYHHIPENDKFWGAGFTDWISVKKAKPIFKGHNQPRIPLNNNYYDLSHIGSIIWQAQLAKEYGIYGFGIYHYWFNSQQNLLTKPAEIILDNKTIDINFCFAWDNISWKRSWSNVNTRGNAWAPEIEKENNIKGGPEILVNYILGDEKDWKKHYNYLLPYFKDSRYIKINNKPIFVIFHRDNNIDKMCDYWNKLSVTDNFDGIFFIFRYDVSIYDAKSYFFKYEPQFSGFTNNSRTQLYIEKIKEILGVKQSYTKFNYNKIWNNILKSAKHNISQPNVFYGAFVNYDDTPRRGNQGIIVKNGSVAKFKSYLQKLLEISYEQNKEFVFLTAWNEWGEGAYLEPDTISNFDYLNAIKEIYKTEFHNNI